MSVRMRIVLELRVEEDFCDVHSSCFDNDMVDLVGVHVPVVS